MIEKLAPAPFSHSFEVTPHEARLLQEEAASRIERHDRFGTLRRIAGVDVAYGGRGKCVRARAAVVVFDMHNLQSVESRSAEVDVTFPYVPGLLTFREAPAALAALQALSIRPDMLMCDGQGLAHPRRCGFASHLGLLADLPSIGVAKSRLVGEYAEPGPLRGDWTPLMHVGEQIGACLRTRRGTRPLFISIGHRVSLQTALRIVVDCLTRFRLPEPIRAADWLSKHR